jgi:hypothetical protein
MKYLNVRQGISRQPSIICSQAQILLLSLTNKRAFKLKIVPAEFFHLKESRAALKGPYGVGNAARGELQMIVGGTHVQPNDCSNLMGHCKSKGPLQTVRLNEPAIVIKQQKIARSDIGEGNISRSDDSEISRQAEISYRGELLADHRWGLICRGVVYDPDFVG